MQGLSESEEVEHGKLNLITGNRRSSAIAKIRTYVFVLDSGVRFNLINCCYSSYKTRTLFHFMNYSDMVLDIHLIMKLIIFLLLIMVFLCLNLYLVMVCMKL